MIICVPNSRKLDNKREDHTAQEEYALQHELAKHVKTANINQLSYEQPTSTTWSLIIALDHNSLLALLNLSQSPFLI